MPAKSYASGSTRVFHGPETSNTVFVEQLYLNVLGRTPAPVGYAGWAAQQQAGVPEVAIIGAFITSAEYHDRFLP